MEIDLDIRRASSPLSKARGLMFRRRMEKGLLIPLRKESRLGASIHSLFVLFRFDAVFLDKEKRVVDVRKSIKPFRPLIIPKDKSKYVLELPSGKSKELDIEEGQKIEINQD